MGRQCQACDSSRLDKTTSKLPEQCRGPVTACRFTIAYTKEVVVGIGPQTYRTEHLTSAFGDTLNKVTSTRGFALGARLAPRFSSSVKRPLSSVKAAAPRMERTGQQCVQVVRQNAHPFNSSAPRPPVFKIAAGPGPGFYETRMQNLPKRIPFQNHLGHGRTITAPVRIICNKGVPVQCKCCDVCVNEDFWISKGKFICNECKGKQQSGQNYLFVKARDCREDHSHEGTEAAVRLRPRDCEKKSKFREAYLELYFS
ncbi:uncharacterized protein LOC132196005 [Neocloeon triangulifer]|uniref:uncharacterized protein LOC132196005 n=1 Tax=Neocloeon triangulifer TaxID=2078957 RepID=UPI00286F7A84|nr:uncharacterized protein LOC132196005 [Neocloeon triangulifer]XP_059474351.1 uncharacterized protein LOC132196005 [Neocloeon triangulifer]